MRPFLRRALVGNTPRATASLQGLRVFTNYLVVSGHVHIIGALLLDHPSQVQAFCSSLISIPAVLHALLVAFLQVTVDVFFFISGFCLMHALAKQAGDKNGKQFSELSARVDQFPRYVLRRWLRLAPVHILLSALHAAQGNSNCIAWDEVAFSANVLRRPTGEPLFDEYCLGSSWSLAPDFHSHLLILLMLAIDPSFQNLYGRLGAVIGLLSLHTSARWVMAGKPFWPPGMSAMDTLRTREMVSALSQFLGIKPGDIDPTDPAFAPRYEATAAYDTFYYGTPYRMGAVLFGALTWLAMRARTAPYRFVKRFPNTSLLAALGVGGLWFVVTHGRWFWGVRGLFEVLHEGFGRIGFCAGVAILVMLTCDVQKDDRKGPDATVVRVLKDFFGNIVFVRLSRFVYSMYLAHELATYTIAGVWPRLTRENFTHLNILLIGFKWYVVTLVFCIPICIAEEFFLTLRERLLPASTHKMKDK